MSYIPEVVLPQKEVDDIEVREYPDDIDDSVELQQLEEQGFGEEQGVEEDIEPLPPPPQKKEKLKKEDIFKPKQPPPKKVGIDPKPNLEEPIVPKIEPVKKKRQLSDAQKAALAKGREKRAANKKQAQGVRQATAPAAGSFAEPVYEPPAEAVAYKQKKMNEDYNRQHPINNGLSQEEIQEMIFQGVQKYDAIRKVRKEKKRKEQARQQHENKVFGDLNSQLRVNDPWAAAFNF
jgi:hypothetical protein